MATESTSSEIIERQRTKLLSVLQQDPDSVLDTLTSRELISEDEYEMLEEITDPLKKSRKLLIVVQKKGEESCRCFLKCLSNAFPEAATILGLNKHEISQQGTEADPFSLGRKTSENVEISSETFLYKERETTGSSGENQEGCCASQVTTWNSAGRTEYEVPASITYLSDGERYEVPDESLYLEEGEYQESVGYPEDAEATVDGGAFDDDLQCLAYNSEDEDDHEYEETMGFPNEESEGEASESSISLEEEEKSTEERKRVFQHVLSCLNMDRSRKLLPDFVKQFSRDRGSEWTPKTPGDLAWNFLMKVQALDLTARDFILRQELVDKESKEDLLAGVENLEIGDVQTINPLDVLCACMLCSDSSLQRDIMSSMYQCGFALPLLLPDAENNKSILMLGAMKDLKKHPTQPWGGPSRETEEFLSLMKMPIISFVRLGHCSFSKSRILNTLLSTSQQKPHKIFLHQDQSVPVLPQQISGGLVEVTWCFPDSKDLKERPHVFQKPVAVANLRGDLESFWTQFGFLVEVSSAVFFFTDCLGEKEWDLLLFLGEDAIERCYFILSPQAKESEEAQIFQRILRLKPSQLLFWEVEEAGIRRGPMEALQAALQEVMSSSLRCVSLEDMASLARELGIQVDQDFEITQDVQVSLRTAEGENQQTHSQTKSPSENQAQLPTKEPGAQHEESQNAQNLHQTPPFMSHPWPLPPTLGNDFYHVSLKDPWVLSSHLGSQQRAKWLYPLPNKNTRVPGRGKRFGIQYIQPWRLYSGEGFMKFSGNSRGHRWNGTFGRAQRQTSRVQTRPESLQTARTFQKSAPVLSHVGHLLSPGSQAKAAGKPQPMKTCAQGMQLTEATRKSTRTASHIKCPNPPSCQPAGASQEQKIPVSHQESQRITKGRPSEPAFQPGSQSTSGSELSPTSQYNSHQPTFQIKQFKPMQPSQKKTPHPQPSQAKPTHPQSSQSKPTHHQPSQAKHTHPQPSQAKHTHPQSSQNKSPHPQSSQSKPTHHQPSQNNPPHHQPSQNKPTHPQSYQSKPTHHQPSQNNPPHHQPSQTRPPHHQPFQTRPPHHQPSQTKPPHHQPSQTKPPHHQPSQTKPPHHQPSQTKPTNPQSFQAKPSPSRSTQFKQHRPHQSQSKPFHPRSSQHTSSQTKPSQAKAYHPRAGKR